jgi:hypothetical protein
LIGFFQLKYFDFDFGFSYNSLTTFISKGGLFYLFIYFLFYLFVGCGYFFSWFNTFFECQGQESSIFKSIIYILIHFILLYFLVADINKACDDNNSRFSNFMNNIYVFLPMGSNHPNKNTITGILDMRQEKHVLHYIIKDKLLPYAIVNIPNEKMHFGVFYFIFFFFFFYL